MAERKEVAAVGQADIVHPWPEKFQEAAAVRKIRLLSLLRTTPLWWVVVEQDKPVEEADREETVKTLPPLELQQRAVAAVEAAILHRTAHRAVPVVAVRVW